MEKHLVDERLKFLEIDSETGEFLREAKPAVAKDLPKILDGFYAKVGSIPELAEKAQGQVDRLKGAQTSHWDVLFEGKFDDTYFQRVERIGEVHDNIGLEPRWYLGGYAFAFANLISTLIDNYGKDTEKLKKVSTAFTKAIFLDLEVAISVYMARRETGQMKQQLLQMSSSLENTLNSAVETVLSSTSELGQNAERMDASTKAVGEKVKEVSMVTEQTNKNVQTAASSSEELTASIQEISQQTERSANICKEAVDRSKEATQRITELSTVAQNIGDVIELINNIAGQTNLLALNATIEAARAGEAGKGFSVVAAEVKTLANQTSNATEEISDQIKSIQENTSRVVSAIESVGNIIEELNQIGSMVSAAVEEQTAVTQEISRSMQQISAETSTVSENMTNVAQETTENGEMAIRNKEMSQEIQSAMHKLKDDLIQVLRTSEAGNRRDNERISGAGLTATIAGPSGSFSCPLKNLSAEGLAAMCENGSFNPGESVTVSISGVKDQISGSVASWDGKQVRITFPASAAVKAFLSSRGMGAAA